MNIDTTLRDLLRLAADREGSVNKVAKATGVPQACLSDFLSGKATLQWPTVCALADHYGWRLDNGRRLHKRKARPA